MREHQAGKVPYLADNDALDYSKVQSVGGVLPAGSDWRVLTEAGMTLTDPPTAAG